MRETPAPQPLRLLQAQRTSDSLAPKRKMVISSGNKKI